MLYELLFFFFVIGCKHGDGDTDERYGWLIEDIDVGSYTGIERTGIGVDFHNQVHIGYGGLKHAYNPGGDWTIEEIVTTGGYGGYADMAVGAGTDAHFSFRDSNTGEMLYVWAPEGVWTTEVIAEENAGGHTAIALDGQNTPYVAWWHNDSWFQDSTGIGLKYAWRGLSGWNVETVDMEYGTGRGKFASIALDSGGSPHIAYLDETAGRLKWAYRDNQAWVIEEVADMDLDSESYTSIAVDRDNNPHILFSGNMSSYAYRKLGRWHVDKPISTWGSGSLVLSEDDVPHIAFHRLGDYLSYATLDGDEWVETELEMVDPNEHTGRATDIALDHDGHPHISYINQLTHKTKHAWYEPEPE
ncbi:MAG: hypothetical protein HN348_32515 [Proteobacteria bacterium]|jgi:hypothetical protein|nr:hypothetical protein [Pseudomonadota bacterium]